MLAWACGAIHAGEALYHSAFLSGHLYEELCNQPPNLLFTYKSLIQGLLLGRIQPLKLVVPQMERTRKKNHPE